ncbi:hypothetical protein KAR91_21500 [Candidatus Pacearchaeota archaeon]|nr:hypothetical protein [Candidatus Pacearchaeota archaeon]
MDINEEVGMLQACGLIEGKLEYRKWANEIPSINFPEKWLVKIIPPFARAIVRFRIAHKDTGGDVSIYLDCYDHLGYFGEPYWEVYPHDGDVARCAMKDIDELLKLITESLEERSGA